MNWISGIAILAALVSVVFTLATLTVLRRKLERLSSEYEKVYVRRFELAEEYEQWLSEFAAKASEQGSAASPPGRQSASETIVEDDALARRRVIDDSVQTLGDVAQRARRRAASHARSLRE